MAREDQKIVLHNSNLSRSPDQEPANPENDEFSPEDSLQDLAWRLQTRVDEIVKNCAEVDWSEDYLTLQVVGAMRSVLRSYRVSADKGEPPRSKFDFEAYKLTGNAESTHGDIALVISWSRFSGVAFYEAKASSFDGSTYPAYSVQQLRRLVTSTPRLSYLLYDRRAQKASIEDWPQSHNWPEEELRSDYHSRTVDANFLKQCRKSLRTAAFLMGQPFGHHFANRILSGRDLDYSRPPLQTIRRWLRVTRRASPLIVSVAVSEPEYAGESSAVLSAPDLVPIELPESSRKLLSPADE